MKLRTYLVLLAVVMAAATLVSEETLAAAKPVKNTCLDCHSMLDGPLQVSAEQYAQNIHSQKGLTCVGCHGGNPQADGDDAMSRKAGFRGKPDRKRIPELCGSCHADAAYIRQYSPSLRTDELSQYRTSIHGKRLAKGDTKVAVCTDCHGVHDIRAVGDQRSRVNPVNVADTCKRCHADREYMKAYGIPTDQVASYSASVHHDALMTRGDLSAPTCTTCHGNHGAAPPGVATVENVCSTCHVFQAQLFDSSPHKVAFAAAGLPGCVTCHSNHRISHPGDSMIGAGAQSVCTNCHTKGDAGYRTAENIHGRLHELEQRIADSKQVLDRAAGSGMEVSDAQMELTQAADNLTKARVVIHSFSETRVDQEINAGLQVAQKTAKAGAAALQDRDYRRKGLAVSLLAIVAAVVGLGLFIRQLEG